MAEIDIEKINERAAADPLAFILGCEKNYKDFTREVSDRVTKNDKIFFHINKLLSFVFSSRLSSYREVTEESI